MSSFNRSSELCSYIPTALEQILVGPLGIAPKAASRTSIMRAAKISVCLARF